MVRLLPQIIFGVAMLALGIVALLFPEGIQSAMLKMIGEKRGFNPPTHVISSIRFGGIVGILIGLFVLWMSWRYYFGK